MLFVVRLCSCVAIVGITLYAYVAKMNGLTSLRMQVPKLATNLRHIQEENRALEYRKEKFEDPAHLMQLLRKPQWSHLRYPSLDEVTTIKIPHDGS